MLRSVTLPAMLAVVGGLATADVLGRLGARLGPWSRLTGAASTVAGAMAIGLVIALPVALVVAPTPDFGGDALLLDDAVRVR